MKLHTAILVIALTVLIPAVVYQSQTPVTSDPSRISIVLERKDGNSWREIDARSILEQNDRVRFRVRTNFSGYLYVTNQSTSGQYAVLFPTAQTGQQNRIESGKDYVIPATDGLFRIAGPPGQEIVYWMLSPVPLAPVTAPDSRAKPAPEAPKPDTRPKNAPALIPRCDDTILRARGDCIDSSAGPKELGDSRNLPGDLGRVPNLKSRDMIFLRQENQSIVSSRTPLDGPLIYEFRLAHR